MIAVIFIFGVPTSRRSQRGLRVARLFRISVHGFGYSPRGSALRSVLYGLPDHSLHVPIFFTAKPPMAQFSPRSSVHVDPYPVLVILSDRKLEQFMQTCGVAFGTYI